MRPSSGGGGPPLLDPRDREAALRGFSDTTLIRAPASRTNSARGRSEFNAELALDPAAGTGLAPVGAGTGLWSVAGAGAGGDDDAGAGDDADAQLPRRRAAGAAHAPAYAGPERAGSWR